MKNDDYNYRPDKAKEVLVKMLRHINVIPVKFFLFVFAKFCSYLGIDIFNKI